MERPNNRYKVGISDGLHKHSTLPVSTEDALANDLPPPPPQYHVPNSKVDKTQAYSNLNATDTDKSELNLKMEQLPRSPRTSLRTQSLLRRASSRLQNVTDLNFGLCNNTTLPDTKPTQSRNSNSSSIGPFDLSLNETFRNTEKLMTDKLDGLSQCNSPHNTPLLSRLLAPGFTLSNTNLPRRPRQDNLKEAIESINSTKRLVNTSPKIVRKPICQTQFKPPVQKESVGRIGTDRLTMNSSLINGAQHITYPDVDNQNYWHTQDVIDCDTPQHVSVKCDYSDLCHAFEGTERLHGMGALTNPPHSSELDQVITDDSGQLIFDEVRNNADMCNTIEEVGNDESEIDDVCARDNDEDEEEEEEDDDDGEEEEAEAEDDDDDDDNGDDDDGDRTEHQTPPPLDVAMNLEINDVTTSVTHDSITSSSMNALVHRVPHSYVNDSDILFDTIVTMNNSNKCGGQLITVTSANSFIQSQCTSNNQASNYKCNYVQPISRVWLTDSNDGCKKMESNQEAFKSVENYVNMPDTNRMQWLSTNPDDKTPHSGASLSDVVMHYPKLVSSVPMLPRAPPPPPYRFPTGAQLGGDVISCCTNEWIMSHRHELQSHQSEQHPICFPLFDKSFVTDTTNTSGVDSQYLQQQPPSLIAAKENVKLNSPPFMPQTCGYPFPWYYCGMCMLPHMPYNAKLVDSAVPPKLTVSDSFATSVNTSLISAISTTFVANILSQSHATQCSHPSSCHIQQALPVSYSKLFGCPDATSTITIVNDSINSNSQIASNFNTTGTCNYDLLNLFNENQQLRQRLQEATTRLQYVDELEWHVQQLSSLVESMILSHQRQCELDYQLQVRSPFGLECPLNCTCYHLPYHQQHRHQLTPYHHYYTHLSQHHGNLIASTNQNVDITNSSNAVMNCEMSKHHTITEPPLYSPNADTVCFTSTMCPIFYHPLHQNVVSTTTSTDTSSFNDNNIMTNVLGTHMYPFPANVPQPLPVNGKLQSSCIARAVYCNRISDSTPHTSGCIYQTPTSVHLVTAAPSDHFAHFRNHPYINATRIEFTFPTTVLTTTIITTTTTLCTSIHTNNNMSSFNAHPTPHSPILYSPVRHHHTHSPLPLSPCSYTIASHTLTTSTCPTIHSCASPSNFNYVCYSPSTRRVSSSSTPSSPLLSMQQVNATIRIFKSDEYPQSHSNLQPRVFSTPCGRVRECTSRTDDYQSGLKQNQFYYYKPVDMNSHDTNKSTILLSETTALNNHHAIPSYEVNLVQTSIMNSPYHMCGTDSSDCFVNVLGMKHDNNALTQYHPCSVTSTSITTTATTISSSSSSSMNNIPASASIVTSSTDYTTVDNQNRITNTSVLMVTTNTTGTPVVTVSKASVNNTMVTTRTLSGNKMNRERLIKKSNDSVRSVSVQRVERSGKSKAANTIMTQSSRSNIDRAGNRVCKSNRSPNSTVSRLSLAKQALGGEIHLQRAKQTQLQSIESTSKTTKSDESDNNPDYSGSYEGVSLSNSANSQFSELSTLGQDSKSCSDPIVQPRIQSRISVTELPTITQQKNTIVISSVNNSLTHPRTVFCQPKRQHLVNDPFRSYTTTTQTLPITRQSDSLIPTFHSLNKTTQTTSHLPLCGDTKYHSHSSMSTHKKPIDVPHSSDLLTHQSLSHINNNNSNKQHVLVPDRYPSSKPLTPTRSFVCKPVISGGSHIICPTNFHCFSPTPYNSRQYKP